MLFELNEDQRALAEFMSELSELAYCTGWMENLEHVLWKAAVEGPFKYGQLNLTNEHIRKIRELSARCGGWIYFDEEKEESFASVDYWRSAIYSAKNAS